MNITIFHHIVVNVVVELLLAQRLSLHGWLSKHFFKRKKEDIPTCLFQTFGK
jgi:hypothetical protein